MFTPEIIEVAGKIAEFYYVKFSHNSTNASKHIQDLKFSKIYFDEIPCSLCGTKNRKLVIVTARPGLFIGVRGENVSKLEELLGIKIHIKEECDSIEDLILYKLENM